jgi:hypothetical protein
MIEIQQTKQVNFEALNETFREAFVDLFQGADLFDDTVTVYLLDTATPEQVAEAEALLEAHDHTVLSSQQQARLERQQLLEQLRQTVAPLTIDAADIDALAEPMQTIARKVQWLEVEILSLSDRFQS